MCVYSMVVDHYRDKWIPMPSPTYPGSTPWDPWVNPPIASPAYPPIPPADINQQIEEFKTLLERAKAYDKKNNEPDCDLESKKVALRELAKIWKIDISFIEKEG